ncbi:MAG: alpha/beta hydrolase [Steroidobacteraceae bacterium]
MRYRAIALIALLTCLSGARAIAGAAVPGETSPPKELFVRVDRGVKLEVLDWGGTGRALVFLAGSGDTAHAFDQLAPRFTDRHHVYGITRRGFGRSDKPLPMTQNYMADRLADDVLEVLDALKLDRPILAGHSIAGEELSSIGCRYPERVAGLTYLDAQGPSAFYDAHGQVGYFVEIAVLLRKLNELSSPDPSLDRTRIAQLLQSNLLHRFEASARWVLKTLPATRGGPLRPDPAAPYIAAMNRGEEMYTDIKGPILAITALPHDYERNPTPANRAVVEMNLKFETRQTDAFEKALPNARVVRLPYANHYIFRSNEADVITDMNAFMDSLH